MKFAISDLLATTSCIAILFALLRLGPDVFALTFVALHFLQFFVLPLSILISTVFLSQERGKVLVVSTNPAWRLLKKLWLLSFVCTLALWLFILFG